MAESRSDHSPAPPSRLPARSRLPSRAISARSPVGFARGVRPRRGIHAIRTEMATLVREADATTRSGERASPGARVFIAMSGGVDSSVAAARLCDAGYEVV